MEFKEVKLDGLSTRVEIVHKGSFSATKRIVILGGGTFSPIRNHLSLSAPAFGNTAKQLAARFRNIMQDNMIYDYNIELVLTRMADQKSNLRTNEDVEKYIDSLLEDEDVKTIVLNVAFCDYDVVDELAGFHGPRFKTSLGDRTIQLRPSKKIIDKIRVKRPDIFLVGFKTTTDASSDEQFLTALKMMKRSKCNLVLANDVITRHNMIITPEESKYEFGFRESTLTELVKMTLERHNLTYNRTIFNESKKNDSAFGGGTAFTEALIYLIKNGGFIENNGNGFTPGHFCHRHPVLKNAFLSSQRKVNHNEVFHRGLTFVEVKGDKFHARGTHKPSVGARSQWLMLEKYPEYDCIIHTHNPLKEGSQIPIASQRPFQCGSLECGMNTLDNLADFGPNIKAVYLDKHGANILFKKDTPKEELIKFIEENLELGVKTT